ncbi:MAG: iron-containing alcohol dehydrogenase [Anaerolineae bacterium]|nr:iron-containing alcohol dehydrogenase [Anaerolineae bacterium]
MGFDFAAPKRIIFGNGTVAEIGPIASQLGSKAFLATSAGRINQKVIEPLLEREGVAWHVFVVDGEPTIDLVQEGVAQAKRNGCDFVIGYGGGSAIDTGKAVSAMMTNPGTLLDYLEVVGKNQPLVFQAAPFIAVPTTAGTGSEVTRNAVLSVPEKRFKVSLRSPLILASVAIVDPELTYSMPPNVTASTGLDALTQVIEPYVSLKASPMTDMFCREGIQRISRSVVRAYQNGSDVLAREDMAWGSLLGGLSLANAGLGAVHGFAAPIGGMFTAPHGAVCASLLPGVVRMNIRALRQRFPDSKALIRYDEIAQIMSQTEKAKGDDAVKFLQELNAALHIPRLSDFGITPADVPQIVEKAAIASSMKANPIQLTAEELSEILFEAL